MGPDPQVAVPAGPDAGSVPQCQDYRRVVRHDPAYSRGPAEPERPHDRPAMLHGKQVRCVYVRSPEDGGRSTHNHAPSRYPLRAAGYHAGGVPKDGDVPHLRDGRGPSEGPPDHLVRGRSRGAGPAREARKRPHSGRHARGSQADVADQAPVQYRRGAAVRRPQVTGLQGPAGRSAAHPPPGPYSSRAYRGAPGNQRDAEVSRELLLLAGVTQGRGGRPQLVCGVSPQVHQQPEEGRTL